MNCMNVLLPFVEITSKLKMNNVKMEMMDALIVNAN